MKVERFNKLPQPIKAGRPAKYPFSELKEAGLKLTIKHGLDEEISSGKSIQEQRTIIKNALNQFIRNNEPTWEATPLIEGNSIVVYRTK